MTILPVSGSRGRRAEALAMGLLVLVGPLHVIACSAGPVLPRTAALMAAGASFVVCVLAGGGRWLDAWRLPLGLLLLTQVGEIGPRLRGPDGFEYYTLARSPLFDRDFELGNDFEGFQSQAQRSATGRPVSRTPFGLALLWTPAIVLTHAGILVARVLGAGVRADGFSLPYEAAVTFASFTFAVAALLLTEAAVRRRAGRPLALLVAFALWVATPLAFYAVRGPSSAHPASALAVAAFLSLAYRHRDSPGWRDWLGVGALGGLMSIVRVQDCVFLLVPLADQILWRGTRPWRRLLAYLAGPLAFGLLQLLVWRAVFGVDYLGEVAEQNYFRGNFYVKEVLLSPLHGLFTWTPVWLLGALGWLIVARRQPRLGFAIFLGFAGALFINTGIDDWWGSISFGQRRFLGLTLLFGLGLGALFEWLVLRPFLTLAALVCGLALWNQQLTVIFSGRHLGGREDPVQLDRLAGAQVEVFFTSWLAAESRLPRWLFVAGYDNLKGVWLDEWPRSLGSRVDLTLPDRDQPLPFLIGEGWLAPAEKGGIAFRRSRGRWSSLRVPIYTPADFTVTLRARSVLEGQPVPIAIRVNDRPVGQVQAATEWSDLRFEIPAPAVLPGLNTLVFDYGITRRDLEPANRGLNSALAVQEVRFERRGPRIGLPP